MTPPPHNRPRIVLVTALAFALGVAARPTVARLYHEVVPLPPPARASAPATFPVSPEIAFFEKDTRFVDLPGKITDEWRAKLRGTLKSLLHVPERSVVSEEPAERPATLPPQPPGIEEDWRLTLLDDGTRLRTVVLRPTAGPTAGPVLALHGHWDRGVEMLFDPDCYGKAIAERLAQAGHTVVAVETRTFGDSTLGELRHQVYVHRLQLQGRTFHGEVLADNRAVIARMRSQGVIVGPLDVLGCSMGAVSAMFVGAAEDDLGRVIVSGGGGSWTHCFSSVQGCCCNVIPGLLERLDAPQLLAASRAERIALELGRYDDTLGLPNVLGNEDVLRSIPKRGGPPIDLHVFDGGHEVDPAFDLSFFAR